MKAYKASGAVGDGALAVLFLGAVGGGLVTGAIEGYVSQWFSLLILFPLLVGGVAGGVAAAVVERRQVRAPMLALVAGLAGGALGQLTVHVVQWRMYAPAFSFTDFLNIAAEQGVQIKHHGRDSGAPLTDLAYWGLFGLELALAAGAGAFIPFKRAAEPFCEGCKKWYGEEQVIGVGNGEKAAMEETIAAIASEQITRAVEIAGEPTKKHAFAVTARQCPQCQDSDALLFMKRITNPSSNKPQVKVVKQGLMPREAMKQLQSAFVAAKGSQS